MKKFTVLFLAGLVILAFGVTASAQAPKLEFRASGFIDTQTFWGENVPQYMNGPQTNTAFWLTPFVNTIALPAGATRPTTIPVLYGNTNPAFAISAAPAVAGPAGAGKGGVGFNRPDAHWEARAHLKFDAIMGPNLSGTIFFEIDTFTYGAAWNSYPGQGREANNFGAWTTDRAAVEVKNIYIDVGLPYFGIPVPITVRVGAQPIGVRPAMLVYSDGTGVTAGIKIDPFLIAPIYAKPLEGNNFVADDVDVYGLHMNAKVGTFTVGGYGLYYQMNSYPLWVLQPTGIAGFPAALTPAAPGSNTANMWWWGLYADGKAGPLNINFDFVYDYGSVEQGSNSTRTHYPHVKYQGWATRFKIDYPWEKFNFGVVGMYATGPDTKHTSSGGNPGEVTSQGTLARFSRGYVVPPGSEQAPGNGESMVVYSMEGAATGGYGLANRANYGGLSPGGFGGTWFGKLYGSMKATPWWKITLMGLYIGDTTAHGNTLGTAFKYNGIPVGNGFNRLRDDGTIGWEFDILNEFQIYNNLRFFTGFGYLFAGDATDVGAIRNGIQINRSISNPWAVRTRLQYTF
jgi:hypothetical protein